MRYHAYSTKKNSALRKLSYVVASQNCNGVVVLIHTSSCSVNDTEILRNGVINRNVTALSENGDSTKTSTINCNHSIVTQIVLNVFFCIRTATSS